MSETLSDDVLSQVREIKSLLRSWRQSRLASAASVNASFDVVGRAVTYTGDPSSRRICGFEPSRVALLFMVVGGSVVYIVPDVASLNETGTLVNSPYYVVFHIHDHPGLVSLGWRFGTATSFGSRLNVVEILDRRGR